MTRLTPLLLLAGCALDAGVPVTPLPVRWYASRVALCAPETIELAAVGAAAAWAGGPAIVLGDKPCDVRVVVEPPSEERAAASTQWDIDGPRITSARISLTAPGGGIDLQSVLTHELGHALGLGHSDEPGSTMWPEIGPGETYMRDPTEEDLVVLRALYAEGF